MDHRNPPVGRIARLWNLGSAKAGPGWFTGVMGTGILAICLAISPVPIPFDRPIALVVWLIAGSLFVAYLTLWVAGIVRDPRGVSASLDDAATAQLWGAPPMACFTIGTGFLTAGHGWVPTGIAAGSAQLLWIGGAAGSMFSASAVPFRMFTQHSLEPRATLGTWLLPVVPPIVASVPAALLNSTWPTAIRGDMLALAYALLGIGMLLAAIVIVIFYGRLVYHKVPDAALVPSVWIVVGPLDQSIAGIIALGNAAHTVWPELARGLAAAALAYGVLVWGFAMYWLAMSIAITLRAVRKHLPFSLGWWAFTFPVGVLTAGTDALYGRTHAHIFAFASVALLALLATMWTLVARRTLIHAAGAVNSMRQTAPVSGSSSRSAA